MTVTEVIKIDPIEPGYVIRCGDDCEWDELVDYVRSEYPNARLFYDHNSIRLTFCKGKLTDYSKGEFEYYRSRPDFNLYVFCEFSDLFEPRKDISEIFSYFEDLL